MPLHSLRNVLLPESITGIRLQPLMLLSTNMPVAYEVLCSVSTPSDLKTLFDNQTKCDLVGLFLWQAETVLARAGTYFINIPIMVLSDAESVQCLLAFPHQGRIIIELQDPENVPLLDDRSRQNLRLYIRALRKAGWSVWLDDWTLTCHDTFIRSDITFDGVKLDRSIVMSRRLARHITRARELAPYVLAEGIETSIMLRHVQIAGADLGQGYFWSAQVLHTSPHSPLSQYSEKWRQPCDKNSVASQTLTVFFTDEDHFFRAGLLGIVNEALKNVSENPRAEVQLVKNEDQADIVIYACLPGELPFGLQGGVCKPGKNKDVIPVRRNIVVVDETLAPSWIACTPEAGVVSRKASREYVQKGIEAILLKLLRPWRCQKYISENHCHLCMKNRLSPRERETLLRFGSGQSVSFMAKSMGCSAKTISVHKRNAMVKLDIKKHTLFYRYANRIASKLFH